jgi:hypothetical protein
LGRFCSVCASILFTGDRIFGTLCPKTGFSAEFLGKA